MAPEPFAVSAGAAMRETLFYQWFLRVSRAIPWRAAGDHGPVFFLPFGAPAQNLVLPMVFEGFRLTVRLLFLSATPL